MSRHSAPTRLELFAAFTAQFPLLTREDLIAIVDDMRLSSGFDRMLEHARAQAAAIGLLEADLVESETLSSPPAVHEDEHAEASGSENADPVRPSGFHPIRRIAV